MTWVAVGVGGAKLLSGLSGAKKQKKQQNELTNYQRSLSLAPVNGQFGQFGVNDGSVDAGAFGGLQSQFAGGAGNVLSGIDFTSGLPPEIMEAMGIMRGGVNQPQQSGLASNLFTGAAGLVPEMSQGFGATRDAALSQMRSSAMPENQRAVDSTMSRLFAQGRLGSTGGANIMGRLAESQNQQDLGFQMAAGGEARASSTDVMARFREMLSGATGIDNEGFDRSLSNLTSTIGAAGIPGELQQQKLGMATNMLGAGSSIQDMIMQAFGGAANLAQAKTNVKVAGAGLNTSTMNNPDFSASPVQDAFGSLFSGMMPQGGIDWKSLFSKIGNRRPGSGGTAVDPYRPSTTGVMNA